MAAVLAQHFELSEAEIVRMTGYRRPGKQIETLKSLGIPARRRPDNTVLVLLSKFANSANDVRCGANRAH